MEDGGAPMQQKINDFISRALTAFIIGCCVRFILTSLFVGSWLIFGNTAQIDVAYQTISNVFFFELFYLWLPKTSGDLVNFQYPYLVIALPFVAATLFTLIFGFIIMFLAKRIR